MAQYHLGGKGEIQKTLKSLLLPRFFYKKKGPQASHHVTPGDIKMSIKLSQL